MDDDSLQSNPDQPSLFEFTPGTVGAVELFPAVWSAVEALAAPEVNLRHAALDRLLELGAPRLSPLVAYLLATRIADPDIFLRARVVRALGEVLSKDEQGNPSPEPVKRHLMAYLSQMRTRPIFALLEVANHDPSLDQFISMLLNASPYAGMHLGSIASDRKCPMPVRVQAVRFIGLVGYLDALPTLERLEARLQSRIAGQQAMPFATPSGMDESELLPTVQATLNILRMH
jgi:HEAT repeat protein